MIVRLHPIAWLRRRHPVRFTLTHLLPILSAVAVAALFLSVFAVTLYARQQSQAAQERKTFDIQSCERGNVLRQKIRDIGGADAQLIRDLLDELLGSRATTPEGREMLAKYLLRLEPSFDKQEAAVAAIELTDCAAALNRAKAR